jgi:hypothetical protein
MIKNNLKKNKERQYEVSKEEIEEINDVELNKISKGDVVENIYIFFITASKIVLKTILMMLKISGIYLLWICLHYFSAHLYVKFCVPNTIIGFLMSPFMIATPHCQGLRWIVYNAAGIINNMWILVGAWIYSIIWIVNRDNHVDPTNI